MATNYIRLVRDLRRKIRVMQSEKGREKLKEELETMRNERDEAISAARSVEHLLEAERSKSAVPATADHQSPTNVFDRDSVWRAAFVLATNGEVDVPGSPGEVARFVHRLRGGVEWSTFDPDEE